MTFEPVVPLAAVDAKQPDGRRRAVVRVAHNPLSKLWSNADLAPNSRTPDGVRDINAWILPEGGYAGTRRTRRCSRAKAIWEMSVKIICPLSFPKYGPL